MIRRIVRKIVVPAMLTALWIWVAVGICNVFGSFDWFRFWVIAGFPYGMRRMSLFLVPVNYGISGSVGVFALDCIIGGLIGGFVLVFSILGMVKDFVWILLGKAVA